MRQYLEIELRESIDPFEIQQQLSRNNILKTSIIDARSIRIWFNDRKITPANVVKLVSAASKAIA